MKCYLLVETIEDRTSPTKECLEVFINKERAISAKNKIENRIETIKKKGLESVIENYGVLYYLMDLSPRPDGKLDVVLQDEDETIIPAVSKRDCDYHKLFEFLYHKYPKALKDSKIDLSKEDYELINPFMTEDVYFNGLDHFVYEVIDCDIDLNK